MNKLTNFAFWTLLVCGVINAILFFASMTYAPLKHLQNYNLFMLTFCVFGCIVNYIASDKQTNRR